MGKHLVLVIHGLYGNPGHMQCMLDTFHEHFPPDEEPDVEILVPSTNAGVKSFDGLKVGAARILDEMFAYLRERLEEGVTFSYLSVIGYSLGGLFGRYVVGVLNQQHFFDDVTPFLFATFATPHIGSQRPGGGVLAGGMNFLGSSIFGVSGNDLFGRYGSSVLEDMADPEKPYYKGLEKFKYLLCFANAVNDRTVPFWAAYITDRDPFVKSNKLDLKRYPLENKDLKELSLPSPFVNMADSQVVGELKPEEIVVTPEERRFKRYAMGIAPFVFPIMLSVTSVSSVVSHYRAARFHSERLQSAGTKKCITAGEGSDDGSSTHDADGSQEAHKESPFDRFNTFLADAIDNTLEAAIEPADEEQTPSANEDERVPSSAQETISGSAAGSLSSSTTVSSSGPVGSFGDGSKGLIATTKDVVEVPDNIKQLAKNLNTLPWEKYTILLERAHSHAEIINRRNLPGQGSAVVEFFVSLFEKRWSSM